MIALLLAVITLTSCGGSKKVIEERQKPTVKKEVSKEVNTKEKSQQSVAPVKVMTNKDKINAYVARYAPIAQKEMKSYGIPASITLAQGILESGAGKGRLAVEANNHFGIKCHDWNGKKIYHDDDEKQECFRKYDNPEYSYRDHSLFLADRKRYSFLFDLKKDDYKQWAKGLKKAGYATDPKYPQKLIDLIERYELYKYDNIVLKKKNKQYKVRRGDTLYSISKKFSMPVNLIKKLNNLQGDNLSVGQTIIIKK